jgi:hypothetical protein
MCSGSSANAKDWCFNVHHPRCVNKVRNSKTQRFVLLLRIGVLPGSSISGN